MKKLLLNSIDAGCRLSKNEKKAVIGGMVIFIPDLTNCKDNERLCECRGIISCVLKAISCSHPTQVLCGAGGPI